jgi:hypothetical protein
MARSRKKARQPGEIDVNIAGRDKDRVSLLFNGEGARESGLQRIKHCAILSPIPRPGVSLT